MTSYHEMNKAEAAAALEEFLRERAPALRRLEQRLHGDGVDPGQLLDGSPESLAALWKWARRHLAARQGEAQLAGSWPSWLRYGSGPELLLSDDSIDLVDGLTSYLCRVVELGAPQAVWRVGHDPVRNYGEENRPVLGRGRAEFALSEYAAARARQHLRGSHPDLQPPGLRPLAPPEDDNLTVLARSLITKLGGGEEAVVVGSSEPLVAAARVGGGDAEWELALSDEVAFEHSDLVDELVAALRQEPGIGEASREDRETILLRVSGWSGGSLEAWVRNFLQGHRP
jgi:hypothetical protein